MFIYYKSHLFFETLITFQNSSVAALSVARGGASTQQANTDIISVTTTASGRKRPPEELVDRSPCEQKQIRLSTNPIDPEAHAKLDIALRLYSFFS